jgi:hypothetical protein
MHNCSYPFDFHYDVQRLYFIAGVSPDSKMAFEFPPVNIAHNLPAVNTTAALPSDLDMPAASSYG